MSYVLACMTQFNGGRKEIVLKARGRAINHAVDIAEIVRRKFACGSEIKLVKIGTEEVPVENGEKLNISTVEITLSQA
ncbi:MAG: DNA-binding protein Alba [Candidatus Aenigmatarchaeota archaeon]